MPLCMGEHDVQGRLDELATRIDALRSGPVVLAALAG